MVDRGQATAVALETGQVRRLDAPVRLAEPAERHAAGSAAAAAPSVGVLTPSLTTVAFGSILINTTTTLPVALTNTGTASVTISAATAAGTGYGIRS